MLEALEENEKLLKAHSEHLEQLVEERTKKLKDAERLATIGETAGMVGHDIRNPLQSIVGEVYLAKDELNSLPEGDAKNSLKESMTTIEEQIEYINKIVTDLQDFAKPLIPCTEEVDLETIIQTVSSTVEIPENVEFTYLLDQGFPKFKADTAYLKRTLTNLFSNAVQAMPNGGKLTLQAFRENGSVVITVEDTGVGIPEEFKSKMFQPLRTTKSKGQGFGLAVCKRLVEAMGGTVTFDSQEGKGTKFTIRLPSQNHLNEAAT
jgi:signal transduction histidine kinase